MINEVIFRIFVPNIDCWCWYQVPTISVLRQNKMYNIYCINPTFPYAKWGYPECL